MPRNYRKRALRPRRKMRKSRVPRSVNPGTATRLITSEIFQPADQPTVILSPSTVGTFVGGQFTVAASEVPQIGSYAALYRQFCIKHLQVILVPWWNSQDPSPTMYQQSANLPNVQGPQFAYAINHTPGTTVPGSMVQLLTDNGAKITGCMKRIVINVRYPKPELQTNYGLLSNPTVMNFDKPIWLNTSANGNTGAGTNLPHHGVHWGIQGFVNGNVGFTAFSVFYKVTLAFRDPA